MEDALLTIASCLSEMAPPSNWATLVDEEVKNEGVKGRIKVAVSCLPDFFISGKHGARVLVWSHRVEERREVGAEMVDSLTAATLRAAHLYEKLVEQVGDQAMQIQYAKVQSSEVVPF